MGNDKGGGGSGTGPVSKRCSGRGMLISSDGPSETWVAPPACSAAANGETAGPLSSADIGEGAPYASSRRATRGSRGCGRSVRRQSGRRIKFISH